MDAKIVNNQASAVHSFKLEDLKKNIWDCKTEDETELEIGID